MELLRVVGIAVIGGVLAVLLRQYRPEYGVLVSLCCCAVILAAVLGAVGQALDTVRDLLDRGGIDEAYAAVLFRALGICVICQLASDACRDCGESAIASKVELAGKLAVLLTSLPLFSRLLTISAELLSL